MNDGGRNYSPGGGGGTSNNGGYNFGGNPGQHNSIDYLRAVSFSFCYKWYFYFDEIISGVGVGWVTNSCSHFVYLLKKHVFFFLCLLPTHILTCLFPLCNDSSLFSS